MKLPKRLPIEEHRKIGAELKRIRQYLIALSLTIPNTYGKTSRVGKQAIRVYEGVDHLRNIMENQMFMDCPEADTNIYYGPIDHSVD